MPQQTLPILLRGWVWAPINWRPSNPAPSKVRISFQILLLQNPIIFRLISAGIKAIGNRTTIFLYSNQLTRFESTVFQSLLEKITSFSGGYPDAYVQIRDSKNSYYIYLHTLRWIYAINKPISNKIVRLCARLLGYFPMPVSILFYYFDCDLLFFFYSNARQTQSIAAIAIWRGSSAIIDAFFQLFTKGFARTGRHLKISIPLDTQIVL